MIPVSHVKSSLEFSSIDATKPYLSNVPGTVTESAKTKSCKKYGLSFVPLPRVPSSAPNPCEDSPTIKYLAPSTMSLSSFTKVIDLSATPSSKLIKMDFN